MNSIADRQQIALQSLRLAMERAPRAMIVADAQGLILVANRSARNIDGVQPGQILTDLVWEKACYLKQSLDLALGTSMHVPVRVHFGDTPHVFEAWRVDPLPGFDAPLVMLRADPSKMTQARLLRAESQTDQASRQLSVAQDERDRLRAEARRLRRLAETDRLTGALNAAAFEQRCKSRLQKRARGVLIFADMNGFKPVNDRFGHAAGDEVLKETARRLRCMTTQNDLLGRLGGDEFGLWLENTGQLSIPDILETLQDATMRPIPWTQDGHDVQLSVSLALGAVCAATEGTRYSALRAIADARMYEDKRRVATPRRAG